MKFAKDLEEEAVPEWKDKYLDYKTGKKKIKAIARAVRNVDDDDDASKSNRKSPFTSLRDAPVYSFLQRNVIPSRTNASRESETRLTHTRSRSEAPSPSWGGMQGDNAADFTPRARPINERSPLTPRNNKDSPSTNGKRKDGPRMTRYGSIIGSPPEHEQSPAPDELRKAPTLELPEPAIDDDDSEYDRPVSPGSPETVVHEPSPRPPPTQLAHTGNAYEITKPTDNPKPPSGIPQRYKNIFTPRRVNSTPGGGRPFMPRMFSVAPQGPPKQADIALEAYREVDFRKAEFFLFLDKELAKVESFYKAHEDQATERLKVLREQLHIMRERRLEEIVAAERKNKSQSQQHIASQPDLSQNGQMLGAFTLGNGNPATDKDLESHPMRHRRSHPFAASVEVTREALDRVRSGHVGKTSRAMGELGTPQWPPDENVGAGGNIHDPRQDYTRKGQGHAVPYRVAKRKLKTALAEYYRGLELLKAYAVLNRKAFRKINKKYDKTVDSKEKLQYCEEKVNKAHFVTSDVLDGYITTTEDLYARYFERGNHKVAVAKLRAKSAKAGDYNGPVFRNGLLIAAGVVFGVQGVVLGAIRVTDRHEPDYIQTQTSYLLQIYAGYFLMLMLVGLFAVDAAIFSRYHVNYQFIFEFEVRNMLDWKQLAEMPAYFVFLLGLTMWCNFNMWGGETMYIYWPVVLIGLSVLLFICPPPLFYPRSRQWFLESNGRLLLAGLYPVEFRDFFLGDMYCSQTYALGNIELFFCLYAHHWSDPPQCNSSHSMLLGFFTTLPGIWRLLQCFRRYYDSKNAVPHLFNGAKYTCTILQYVSLSLWRMHRGPGLFTFFLLAASINSTYCTWWDLFYDWSMPLNLTSKPYPLLRPILAYRRHVWWYYVAMVIDPIIRFNWIFYAIFKDDIQHSSLISFFVGFSEVFRRAIWVLFRVENEHCSNVGRFRAQRDPALPYPVEHDDEELDIDTTVTTDPQTDGTTEPSSASGRDVEHGTPIAATASTGSSLRQRRTRQAAMTADSPVYRALKRAGSAMLTAHSQDYERRRPRETDEKPGKDDSDSE